MESYLVANGTLITLGPECAVIDDGAICVEGGRIADLGPTAEVKARAGGEGFKTLERWLPDHALLFLRRDRAPPLVLAPWDTYGDLVRALASLKGCLEVPSDE